MKRMNLKSEKNNEILKIISTICTFDGDAFATLFDTLESRSWMIGSKLLARTKWKTKKKTHRKLKMEKVWNVKIDAQFSRNRLSIRRASFERKPFICFWMKKTSKWFRFFFFFRALQCDRHIVVVDYRLMWRRQEKKPTTTKDDCDKCIANIETWTYLTATGRIESLIFVRCVALHANPIYPVNWNLMTALGASTTTMNPLKCIDRIAATLWVASIWENTLANRSV